MVTRIQSGGVPATRFGAEPTVGGGASALVSGKTGMSIVMVVGRSDANADARAAAPIGGEDPAARAR
jgi:hypothetical protein